MAYFGGTDHVEMQCGTCGVWHTIPKIKYDTAYKEGGFWHCPNGHSRGWQNGHDKQEIVKLCRERDRLQQRVAEKDDDIATKEREVAAQKGLVTKLKKRAAAGTCPCCQRTFTNMATHMRKQHPEMVADNVVRIGKSA